jgi:hypothetical protein
MCASYPNALEMAKARPAAEFDGKIACADSHFSMEKE